MRKVGTVLSLFAIVALATSVAGAKDHGYQRGMIVSMSSVPCGSQVKRHKKTQELLCQEYVLRSNTMEYHIRQGEPKRTDLLPVGQETEFRVDKDRIRVRVPGSAKYRALLIPDQAVGTDQGQKFVYVVNDQDVADRRTVKLGPVIDGLRVVREGIHAGEWVVVNGLMSINQGVKVKPQKAAMAESRSTTNAGPVAGTN